MIKDEHEPELNDVLQPGKNMLAAGYCMYGSSCTVCNIAYSISLISSPFSGWAWNSIVVLMSSAWISTWSSLLFHSIDNPCLSLHDISVI